MDVCDDVVNMQQIQHTQESNQGSLSLVQDPNTWPPEAVLEAVSMYASDGVVNTVHSKLGASGPMNRTRDL